MEAERPRVAPADASDPDGLSSVIYAEELHWGCAGIALAISASARWPRRHRLLGHARADRRAGSPSASAGRRRQARRLRRHRGRRRVRRQVAAHDRQARRGRLDPERHQDLHLQRRHRRRGGRRSRPSIRSSATAARPPSSCRGTPPACRWATRSQARHPRVADGRGRARGLPSARGRPPGRRREARAQARARPLRPAPGRSGALATFEITRPLVGASALGDRAGGLRVDARVPRARARRAAAAAEQRVQQVLADVATEIEAARLLVWRAAWMGRTASPMTGGQGSMSKLKAGDVAMWATTTLMDLVGPERRSRPGTRSRSCSATRRSTSCSRARRRSSAWSSRACRRPSTRASSRRPSRCSSRLRERPGRSRHGLGALPRQPVGARAPIFGPQSHGRGGRPGATWEGHEGQPQRSSSRGRTPRRGEPERCARRPTGGSVAGPRLDRLARGGRGRPALRAPRGLARLSADAGDHDVSE